MTRHKPHIVCFAPYTDWSIHSARQVTILNALRQRGCSVTYVTCDGAFSDCDLLQSSTGAPSERPANACLFCQARVATKLAGWGMPFRWLGQWLTQDDRKKAAAWVGALKPGDYINAHFEKWPVGKWVKSSVHRHLRHNLLDLADPRTAAVYGSYLYSGVLACLGLDRLFAEETPDVQLLFNGRMGPTRIALELAKLRGIRTICEERAYVPGRLMLFDNANCLDFQAVGALWEAWRDEPMLESEIKEVGDMLADRWHGRSTDVSAFSAAMGSTKNAITSLNLDPTKQTWALYTSSLDEAADLDTSGDAYESQFAWIDDTIAFVAQHPQIQLVIRIHPNAGSKKSLGKNEQDLIYFETLATRLPNNVRLVPSNSTFGSYDLAMAASLGLIWRSSIGLEMAAMGRPIIRVGSGPLAYAEFMNSPATPPAYLATLSEYAKGENRFCEASTIQAWRFAHTFFYRWSMDFPLVKQPKWFVGEMAYDNPAALAPGADETLDHICGIFMDHAPLYRPAPRRAPELTAAEENEIRRRVVPYQQKAL